MMKFGLLTAILDGWTYEEAVDIAAEMGFRCLEVACWPAGKAERRYAGVSHIDCARVLEDDDYARHVVDYAAGKGLTISSLAFYPNTMDPDLEKRAAAIDHLKTLIRASQKLGVGMVTTFIGRDQHKTREENYQLFDEIWPPIIRLAEECGVKVAIENCPMLFGADQWPGGQPLCVAADGLRQNRLRIQGQAVPCPLQGHQAVPRKAGGVRRAGLSAGLHGSRDPRPWRRELGGLYCGAQRHPL